MLVVATTEPATTETSTSGIGSNLAGALAYVFGAVTGVLMLVVEGDDDYVRFHAIQSIAVTIGMMGLYLVLGVGMAIVSQIPAIGGILALLLGLLYPVIGLVGFVLWVLLMYKAYSGERYALPVVGSFAANQ